MQVVSLKGSPRTRGNSSALADALCERMQDKGAEVRSWNLNELAFRGCQACYLCKTELETCALEDDLTPVLDAVRSCDVLVLATPVYFSDVSAQTKAFIDRTFSFLHADYQSAERPGRLEPGKRLVFVQAQAHPDRNQFRDIYSRYSTFFIWNGFRESEFLRACGFQEPGEAARDPELLQHVEELAEKMTAP
ncbi:MAG: flavodoxin family protein [Desulfohalobiaceae bacterium]|nr:flavodoxin family protein [Desulfohalobiaceae bacterium]